MLSSRSAGEQRFASASEKRRQRSVTDSCYPSGEKTNFDSETKLKRRQRRGRTVINLLVYVICCVHLVILFPKLRVKVRRIKTEGHITLAGQQIKV